MSGRPGLTFRQVEELLASGEVARACAVGLPGIGGYNHESYMAAASRVPGLTAVAALTQSDPALWPNEIERIRALGYLAVKFHPRLLGLNTSPEVVQTLLGLTDQAGMALFYCSFAPAAAGGLPQSDPLWSLTAAVNEHPGASLVIVHGGAHRLWEYAETFRYCPNVLIDLSFTMARFPNSRLALDVVHVIQTLDRRACIGSDSPDLPWQLWTATLGRLSSIVDEERWERVSHSNLADLFARLEAGRGGH